MDMENKDLVEITVDDDRQELGIGTLILGGIALLAIGGLSGHLITKKAMDKQIDEIIAKKIEGKMIAEIK